jgi:sigma-E factor negative regulatory protein RseC
MSDGLSTVRATVRAIEGNDAVVEVAHGGCGRCHETGGCGGQQLTQMFCSGPKVFKVPNGVGAGVGDAVTVAIAPGVVRRTANLAYGVPIVSTLLGALLGTHLAADMGGILGAAIGLALSFAWVRHHAANATGSSAIRPYIVSRL